jgi:hypothetical protein
LVASDTSEQRANVPPPGIIIRIERRERLAQRTRNEHSTSTRREIDDTGAPHVLRLHALPVQAEAERDLLIRPPGDRRVDIDRLDVELDRVRRADPVTVVFGDKAKRGAKPTPT